jgi:hypothetical protein
MPKERGREYHGHRTKVLFFPVRFKIERNQFIEFHTKLKKENDTFTLCCIVYLKLKGQFKLN